MPRYEKDSTMTLLGDELVVNDVLKSLVLLPEQEIVTFFKEINLNFPRELRMDALRETFRAQVFQTRQERHNLADEMNYRLSWFNQFSEVQLVNLFKFYKNEELFVKFKEILWLNILENITDRNIAESQLAALIKIAHDHALENEGELLEVNPVLYNKALDDLFYDDENRIDGLIQEEIRPVLYRSSTITEIRELGKKYGVNVPTRLKKNELIAIICEELKERDEYTEEIEAELKKMNLVLIQRYAKVNDIKASPELKKEEVIEYVLANAEATKEVYYVPSPSLYDEIEEEEAEIELEEEAEIELEEEEVVLEEELVLEELVEEETLTEEEPLEEEETEEELLTETKYIHTPKTEAFDTNSVERTFINVYDFSGNNKTKFKPELQRKDDDSDNGSNEVTEKLKKSNRRKTIWVVLLTMFITIIIGVLIALLGYGYLRSSGDIKIEHTLKLPEFILKVLDFFRKLFT